MDNIRASRLVTSTTHHQTNLISDVAGKAASTDPNLINPWGLARGTDTSSTPWWVPNAGSGNVIVYDGNGGMNATVVTVLPAGGAGLGSPAGITFAGGKFVSATLDGTIARWPSTTLGGTATTVLNHSKMYVTFTSGELGGYGDAFDVTARFFFRCRTNVDECASGNRAGAGGLRQVQPGATGWESRQRADPRFQPQTGKVLGALKDKNGAINGDQGRNYFRRASARSASSRTPPCAAWIARRRSFRRIGLQTTVNAPRRSASAEHAVSMVSIMTRRRTLG